MQVLRIKLTHLHNDEWYEFHDDFKKTTEKHSEDALNITDLRRLYLTQFDKSPNINNLLEDLDGYTADLSLLALNEWVKALRQAEDKFLALRSQRIEEAAGKPQGLMIDIRRQVDMLSESHGTDSRK